MTTRDVDEIRDLVLQFADAVTRHDPAAFGGVWAQSAVWEIEAPSNVHVEGGPDDMLVPFRRMRQRWGGFVQICHSTIVNVQPGGENALARSQLTEMAAPLDGDRGYFNLGMYEDQLVHTEQGWRFAHRSYRYLYLDASPLSGSFPYWQASVR